MNFLLKGKMGYLSPPQVCDKHFDEDMDKDFEKSVDDSLAWFSLQKVHSRQNSERRRIHERQVEQKENDLGHLPPPSRDGSPVLAVGKRAQLQNKNVRSASAGAGGRSGGGGPSGTDSETEDEMFAGEKKCLSLAKKGFGVGTLDYLMRMDAE